MKKREPVKQGDCFKENDSRVNNRIVRVVELEAGEKALCESIYTNKRSRISVASLQTRWTRQWYKWRVSGQCQGVVKWTKVPSDPNAYLDLLGRLRDPQVYESFYLPRQMDAETREPDLVRLGDVTRYNYKREHAIMSLAGDRTRSLPCIHALLMHSKKAEANCVVVPRWLHSALKQIQATEWPSLYGFDGFDLLIGIGDHIYFADQNNPPPGEV